MEFSLTQLFTIGLTYLGILFGSAYAAERGWLPRWLTRHPFIRVLSLGVFIGAIGLFGAVGFAARHGSGYLLYFFGASAAFIVAPLLLGPLSRVALAHKLGSLADVFAFRYPASWVGGLVSLLLLIGVLPLIAMQINVVAASFHLLNQDISEDSLAILFCVTMIVFAMLFGARHLSTRDKHQGLVFALGIESIIKLLALVAIATYVVFGVFDGPGSLQEWLTENREVLVRMETPLSEGESRSMLLIFFAAAVAMPHVYHILLTENDDAQLLSASRWGFPAYMLMFSACIPPIVWGAIYLGADTPPEYYALGLGLAGGHNGMTILALVAGLAAASGVLIVSTLALASMTLNHLLLPLYRPIPGISFYSLLINSRRILILATILGAYVINRMIHEEQELINLGMLAFVAVLQFLPGLIGAFYWKRANKTGLALGLAAGFAVWFLALAFPLVSDLVYTTALTSSPLLYEQRLYDPAEHAWHFAATASLILNGLCFIAGSLLTRTSIPEMRAANDCISDTFTRPHQGEVLARSIGSLESSLTEVLGQSAANREVSLALEELGFSYDEHRPHALTLVRNRIESNLSTLLGQTMAHSIINRAVPFKAGSRGGESVHTIETRLEGHHSELTGITAELDALRRYHRQILQDLPTAVCIVGPRGQVLSWNRAMEELTGVEASRVVGSTLTTLPKAWHELMISFAFSDDTNESRRELNRDEQPSLLLNLHKASISALGETVIVIEDMTEEYQLEQQMLHQERLASIGQLAAGVAHEIGNPITGIACLAQNLRLDSDNPEVRDASEQILDQTNRISSILQSLVNFSRDGNLASTQARIPVNMRQCTDEAISLLSLSQDTRGVLFDNRCPPDLKVRGDPQRLAQVFVNVLSNARDASEPGGKITIDGSNGGDEVCVTVTDEGHGVRSSDLKQIFDPFFTTKDPGQGTGLGLAIVNSIVEEHSGKIVAESRGDAAGTRIVLTLPALTA